MQGLRLAPLVQAMPDVRLQVLMVDDLVAAGYLTGPGERVSTDLEIKP